MYKITFQGSGSQIGLCCGNAEMMMVEPIEYVSGYRITTPLYNPLNGYSITLRAQHAHAPDAAARRQDRAHFGIWFRADSFPDLSRRRG